MTDMHQWPRNHPPRIEAYAGLEQRLASVLRRLLMGMAFLPRFLARLPMLAAFQAGTRQLPPVGAVGHGARNCATACSCWRWLVLHCQHNRLCLDRRMASPSGR